MGMSDPGGRNVRIRTASDRKKALAQYQELRRAGRTEKAVILCEMKDGSFQVLGQGMSLDEIAAALMIAAQAITHAHEQQNVPKLEAHQEPISVGEKSRGTIPKRMITLDAEGIMVPPPGETITSCGECHHPRWYILLNEADEGPSRYACAHCGNEVVVHRIVHPEGRA